jgi:hypothetical protein
VYEEIETLMHNIKELNNGDEIGGWLLGDWIDMGERMELICDKFYIPEQEVSSTEVDISPESIISTIKELGIDESNRIKGHWHIHPFSEDTTDWSSIDEDKITDFMKPDKGREIFVFLLSSKSKIKARVQINYTAQFLGKKFTVTQKYDNLEVNKFEDKDTNKILEKLKSVIADKIKRPVKNLTYYMNGGAHKKKDEEYYDIKVKGTKVIAILDDVFGDWVINKAIIAPEMLTFENKHKKKNKLILVYERKDADSFSTILDNTLFDLAEKYVTETEDYPYKYNSGWYRYGGWF